MSKSESEPESTAEETSGGTSAAKKTSAATAKKKPAEKSSDKTAAAKSSSKTAAKSSSRTATATASKDATTPKRGAALRERFRRDELRGERAPLLSVRLVLMVVLVLAGIAYVTMTWRALGANPPESWGLYDLLGEDKTRRWVWELDLWNYAIGFGAILVGLIVGAHPSTPLGRGNGVVVGMLTCFGVGLLWICTFYLFADNITDIWVFGALGQWNLVVGIAFMAVGFSYATKWE